MLAVDILLGLFCDYPGIWSRGQNRLRCTVQLKSIGNKFKDLRKLRVGLRMSAV